LVEVLSASVTFWIYAVVCVIGFAVIYKTLPETKGISLEKLERMLVKNEQKT
jgi:SP family sugar porter-like MFS transporter